jgi:hypothetical protein
MAKTANQKRFIATIAVLNRLFWLRSWRIFAGFHTADQVLNAPTAAA